MKRRLYFITFILLFSFFYAFSISEAKASDSEGDYGILNKTDVFTEVGKTTKLKLLKTKLKPMSWKSLNPKVVKVDKKGNVKALKPGKATVEVKYGNARWIWTRICDFEVVKKKIKIIKPKLPVTVHTGSGDRLYVTSRIHKAKVKVSKDEIELEMVVEKVKSNDWRWCEAKVQLLDEDDIAVYELEILESMADKTKKKIKKKIYLNEDLKHGKTYKLLFVDDGYVPKPEEKGEDKNKPEEPSIKLILPNQIPFIKHNLDYKDDIESSFKISSLTYTSSGDKVKLLFEIEKYYDKRGSGQSDSCKIGWKLYDWDNYVVESGTVYSESLREGDKTRETETIYDLKKGETYRLEILNVN